ncbi:MAG: hypothetical protein RBS73_12030 [Prolixibacteraceae bacterium]|jgi:hypothetical protein|nr:hypothetical protein [Prolixibacteraceae bacterium]
MPYRRLPNTDQARLRAMEACLGKGKITPIRELAFSPQSLERLQMFYPKFSSAIRQLQVSKENQFKRAKDYGEIVKKAKLYISHFMQVLNFGIMREEIKPEVREYYGMDVCTKAIPPLNLESHILKWGERVITGEQKRTMQGGSPIYNPSIALVKVHFEEFKDAYRHQKMLQNITNRASAMVSAMREEADSLIQQIWNEVEDKYDKYPEEVKRKKASGYGVVYVYRISEIKRMEASKLQRDIIFS